MAAVLKGWVRRLGIVVLVVVAVFLSARAFQTWQVLRQAPAALTSDTGRIRPWMSVRLIARAHHVPLPELAARLGAAPSGNATLLDIARQRGIPVRDVEDETRRAVSDLQGRELRPSPAGGRGP